MLEDTVLITPSIICFDVLFSLEPGYPVNGGPKWSAVKHDNNLINSGVGWPKTHLIMQCKAQLTFYMIF